MPLFNFIPLTRTQTIDQSFNTVNADFTAIDGAFVTVQNDLDAITAVVNSGVTYRFMVNTTAADGDTVFSTAFPYGVGTNSIAVYSGGLFQVKSVHWVETDSNTITFTTPRVASEHIVVIQYILGSGSIINLGGLTSLTETPTGLIDSTDGINGNGTYTLTQNIAIATTPEVIISGFLRLSPYIHFTWANNVITILPGYKPAVGETIQVTYQY